MPNIPANGLWNHHNIAGSPNCNIDLFIVGVTMTASLSCMCNILIRASVSKLINNKVTFMLILRVQCIKVYSTIRQTDIQKTPRTSTYWQIICSPCLSSYCTSGGDYVRPSNSTNDHSIFSCTGHLICRTKFKFANRQDPFGWIKLAVVAPIKWHNHESFVDSIGPFHLETDGRVAGNCSRRSIVLMWSLEREYLGHYYYYTFSQLYVSHQMNHCLKTCSMTKYYLPQECFCFTLHAT